MHITAAELASATGITTTNADRILAHFDDANTAALRLSALITDLTATDEQITAAVNVRAADLATARTVARDLGLPDGDIERLALNARTGAL
ncbi:hypothetical protein [Gordonia malaquae]|uniref:hypothetical protein n=1 Tax=Gordonia malaquae TaxID=410332 RepID=UPI0030197025